MQASGIYKIQSIVHSDRCYIGSTINFRKRWNKHLQDLKKEKHHSKKLQDHIKKYGIEDLIFIIIEPCFSEFLINREQYYIDILKPWFNICQNAGNCFGVRPSIETRKKMSEKHKGLNTWLKGKKLSKEHCKTLSEKLIGNKRTLGFKHSPETLKKMSECRMGEKNQFYGKHHTVESKQKISKTKVGKNKEPKTEEHKQHLRESWLLKKINAN